MQAPSAATGSATRCRRSSSSRRTRPPTPSSGSRGRARRGSPRSDLGCPPRCTGWRSSTRRSRIIPDRTRPDSSCSAPASRPGTDRHDQTSIVCFQREDRPGSLLGILQEFAARAINLTRLESRPTKTGLGRYCFVIDFAGHVSDELVADALRNLAAKHGRVKFLGTVSDGEPRRPRAAASGRKGLEGGLQLGRGAARADRAARQEPRPGQARYIVGSYSGSTVLAEEATRETFANLPVWAIAFWYFLIFVSTGILFYGIYRLARKYRQGRGPAEVDRPRVGPGRRSKIVLSHSWIRRRDPLLGARAPVRLLRLHGAVRRNGDPRCPGRLCRPGSDSTSARAGSTRLLALPRRLRRSR